MWDDDDFRLRDRAAPRVKGGVIGVKGGDIVVARDEAGLKEEDAPDGDDATSVKFNPDITPDEATLETDDRPEPVIDAGDAN